MNKKFLKKAVAVTTTVATTVALSGVSVFAPVFIATAASHITDGDIIKTTDNFDVYIVKNTGDKKFKRLILNPEVFNSYGHLEWDNIEIATQAEMDMYITSELVRAVGDPKVYKLTPNGDVGTRQWVNMTAAEFISEGFDWDAIYEINEVDRNNYTLGSDVAIGGVIPTNTGVTVSMASDSPAAMGVAKGAANVVFTKVSFVGGTDNNTITAITVTRSGLAADADITDVKLWDGVTQLSSTQALNTVTHKAVFTGLGWVVPSGATKTLTITASVATGPTVGNVPQFGIAAASDIVGASVVNGTFPVNGNGMTIAGVSVGILDVTVRSVPGNNNPVSGSTDQEIASWTFDAEVEGMSVSSIKLTQIGSAANADMSNIMLKIGGVQIGSTVTALATDGTATFDLASAPIVIDSGTSKIIFAHADIAVGVTTSRTVQFEITNAADVVAFGSNSGGSVTITQDETGDSLAFVAQDGVAQTISQGTILTVTANGATNPSSQTFVRGASQVLVSAFRFSAGAGEDQRVARLKLGLGDTGQAVDATDLSNVTLYTYDPTTAVETQVGTPTSFVGALATYGANTTGLDSGVFDVLENGNVIIHVRADISSAATWTGANMGIFISEVRVDGIKSQGDIGAVTSGDDTVDAIGDSAITKHSQADVGTITLAVSPSTPAAQDVVPGTLGFEFAKFDFTMASEAATLSSLTLNLCDGSVCSDGAAGTAESADFTNVKLWNGSTILGTVASPSGSATFSFNLNLPKDQTVTLSVTADVPTTAIAVWNASTSSVAVDLDITAIGVSSNATISDPGADAIGKLITAKAETLTVAFQALPASTVVVNASQVVISKVVLTAGTVGDVRITSMTFTADDVTGLNGASVASANLGSLTLYDGTTVIGGPKSLTDGTPDTVVFSGLNLLITKGTQKLVELKANALVGGTNFFVGFADLTGTTDVVATGALSNATIYGTGTDADDSGQLTISTAGALAIAIDAGTPDAALVAVGLTGKSGVEFSKFKLSATNEAIAVESITVTLLQENNDTSDDNDVPNFASLTLGGSSTVFPTGDNLSAVKTYIFTFSPELIVPKDGNVVLTLTAEMNGTSNGANSTTTPQFTIAANTDVTSKGVDSGATIVATGTATAVNEMTIVRTKPTFALCTASICSKASPSGALVAGVTEVVRFRVTADAGNDVLFDGSVHNIRFTVASNLSDTATSTADLYDAATDAIIATQLAIAGSGGSDGIKNGATLDFVTANVTIPAGGWKELYVKADLASYNSTNDFFRLDILKTASDLSWGDGVTSDITSTLTDGLPLTGGTLTR